MIEYYPYIKNIHVTSVVVSLTLFALRGAAMAADAPWRRHVLLRATPHVVDTVLLSSALMLAFVLRQYPFVQGWVTAKVLALVLYIVLGSIALRHGRTRRIRLTAFVAALLCAAYIVSVARAHSPLGLLVWLT